MELTGHSGCKLWVVNENGNKRVKKRSPSVAYNIRLKTQMKKQMELSLKGFKKCEVFDSGYEDGLFYFMMDYINGKTLSEHISSLELERIGEIVDILGANMNSYKTPNLDAEKIFKAKIASLNIGIRKMEMPYIKEAFQMLNDFSWKYIISSPCHGDLTLENIIIQGDRFLLIDCLDSFYDSWIIDIAKVFQDVDLMWSYRKDEKSDSNLIIRLTVMRDLLLDKIACLNEGDHLLETLYYTLLLNLLRIYPYTYEKKQRIF